MRSAPIIVPGPPVYSPGMVVAPGAAAVVTRGPDIVDIAIVSMFLVMAASAATGVLKGSGEDWEGAGALLECCAVWCVLLCTSVVPLDFDLDYAFKNAEPCILLGATEKRPSGVAMTCLLRLNRCLSVCPSRSSTDCLLLLLLCWCGTRR